MGSGFLVVSGYSKLGRKALTLTVKIVSCLGRKRVFKGQSENYEVSTTIFFTIDGGRFFCQSRKITLDQTFAKKDRFCRAGTVS